MEHITDHPRLFRLAPEAVHVSARYVYGEGWSVVVSVRRGDEQWQEVEGDAYAYLTTPELVDVLSSSLIAQLGL